MHPSDALALQLIELLGLPTPVESMVLTFKAREPVIAQVTYYPDVAINIRVKQQFECYAENRRAVPVDEPEPADPAEAVGQGV